MSTTRPNAVCRYNHSLLLAIWLPGCTETCSNLVRAFILLIRAQWSGVALTRTRGKINQEVLEVERGFPSGGIKGRRLVVERNRYVKIGAVAIWRVVGWSSVASQCLGS